MSAYVASIESYGRKQKGAIDQVTIIDNRPALKKDFIMPGLRQDVLIDRPVSTGQILPDVGEDFIQEWPQAQKRTLKDRF